MRGLTWRNLQLPLAAGRNQKADDRALQPPELAEAIDVQFEELGGLQTRKPFSLVGSTTATDGTISTARRMYANGSELVLFTEDALYSWNDQLNRWVYRAEHLAVEVEEQTVYATSGDQYDCDRAELSGIVYHAWCDASVVYVAATDKASGAVIMAPTALGGVGTRPRLVALSTRVLLFWHDGTDSVPGTLWVYSIDPTDTDPATNLAADLAVPLGNGVLASPDFNLYYDATRILTTDTAVVVARRATTTSYTIATVAADATVSDSTKARTCDGPIAVSSDPTGATVQVLRAVTSGTAITGDRITVSGLADAATAQAVGTYTGTIKHITAAHRSTQDGGAYRCYAFWTSDETTTGGALARTLVYNYVDTGGTIGTMDAIVYRTWLASRAFSHDGHVYVWAVFNGESSFSGAAPAEFRSQLQNTYFLYRDDETLHAKAVFQRAGGAQSIGWLPGVALTSGTTGYSWCGTERRIIPVGSAGLQKAYADRGPRDITFTFDSNSARRCVRLGGTLYVSGAEILQYDGVGLFEVGFHIYPWYFAAAEVDDGSLEEGTYTYKVTWRWENAKGELDRSTTATTGEVTISAATHTLPNGVEITGISPLHNTRKTTTKPVVVEVWRTAKNPTEGAPFFLVTSKDPSETTNPNRFLPNLPTSTPIATFQDEFADSTATTKETNPENGDVLENLAPPSATIITATDTRIFLAGVAGDPDRVWYSKLRGAGEVAAFHDGLTFDVPRDGGDITAIAFLQGICVVFREYATYMFPGDGFDNAGRGQNYGPPQVLSYDVGCRDTDSIAVTPEGIAFQSSKGKYLLTRGWTMKPIGLQVSDYDSETVVAAHVVPGQHEVRFLTSSRMLVWDYLADQWAERTIASAVHAAVWGGTYHYLAAAGPYAEQTTYSGTAYGMDVETAWIKPADLQGAVSIRKLQVLGEVRSACVLRTRVAYDYKTTWVDDNYWTVVPSTAGLPLQHEVPFSRRKMQAVKLRITVTGAATQATLAITEGVPLTIFGGESHGQATEWAATLTAVAPGSQGNGITITVAAISGTTSSIEVRDHQTYSSSAWSASANNVGVLITVGSTAVSIAEVEAAISAYSDLVDVTTAHVGAALVDLDGFAGATIAPAGSTSGGAFASPTGESIKLTGLGLEVGLTPHLFKRYPRS